MTFDTRYETRRRPAPFGEVEWESQTIAKAQLAGKPNDEEIDDGYTIEMAIPLKAFEKAGTSGTAAKASGIWRMNFFVMDSYKGGQQAVAWSAPLMPDFHILERFGEVEFLNAESKEPAAAASVSVSGAGPGGKATGGVVTPSSPVKTAGSAQPVKLPPSPPRPNKSEK